MTDSDSVLAKTLRGMIAEARTDGTITSDEQDIINQVSEDLEYYQVLLNDCLQDGHIDAEEKDELEKFSSLIIKNAEDVAIADGRISSDEENLLMKLSELLLHKFSHR